jgi:hypothetical protein
VNSKAADPVDLVLVEKAIRFLRVLGHLVEIYFDNMVVLVVVADRHINAVWMVYAQVLGGAEDLIELPQRLYSR